DYGLIGDLRTAALIGPGGSLDFMCFPKFDSPSIFCATVDAEKGGRYRLRPDLPDAFEKRLYLPDTNILLTRFLADAGVAEVSSFLRLSASPDTPQALVRRAKCVRGEVNFELLFQPRFNYARSTHRVERRGPRELIFISQGEDRLTLRFSAEVDLDISGDGDATARFRLRAGEAAAFFMEEANAESACCGEHFSTQVFKETSNYWRRWIARARYTGRWREAVHRSALALKLLTSREYGSIIAAPCFGFPNEIGGERNWDYRYTWLRDAAFTIYALMRLGYTGEAAAFMGWIEDRIRELPDKQELEIMYRIDGQRIDGEIHLDHLEGYRHSRPIRVGSTNHGQRQLDIYGELIDAVYLYDKWGEPVSYDFWKALRNLLDLVCRIWREPDAGIWEVRGGDREFLFSRVMAWVALDRGIRLARKRGLPAPLNHWIEQRDLIYETLFAEFWSSTRQAFTQSKGSEALDAATLIMPLVRIISPTDPRWLSTLRAIENDLAEDSLVYRYHVGEAFSDELTGREGTFSICSFWFIECVSRSGDLPKARYLFEKMLGYSNSLGLFSEQIGRRGEFLGNVPQAFTHLSMISAAYDLDRRLDRSGDRAVSGGLG
ncbi:MAG: glycoside hydrolase family 15 protein, partial [Opitutales bacterium]